MPGWNFQVMTNSHISLRFRDNVVSKFDHILIIDRCFDEVGYGGHTKYSAIYHRYHISNISWLSQIACEDLLGL